MRAEYLLFDLLVVAGPLALTFLPRADFRCKAVHVVIASALVAGPFLAWDACVTGRHWWFDDRYTLGLALFGLPLEEILFFFAVPYACIFAWETLIRRPDEGRHRLPGRWPAASLALGGVALALGGLEYTGLVALALALALALDRGLGTDLVRRPSYWAFLGVVTGLNLVCNGYLTGRPIVHYDESYLLGIRIFTVPVEDLGYGAALLTAVLATFEALRGRRTRPSWLARTIRRRFGGYRHALVDVDPALPWRATAPRRVAVVGGGLAGLSTAALLAERGIAVTLYEKDRHLGGKLGAWTETMASGRHVSIEHGFHAFFGNYYNLRAFLDRAGLSSALVPIDTYLILTADGRRFDFGRGSRVPGLNLLSLARQGVYRVRDVLRRETSRELEAFLRYDPDTTFRDYDDLSFDAFARRARLPPDLRLCFSVFARAFFSDDDRLSTAELIKSFHFYYLSHDRGLDYDYLAGSYREDFLVPFERLLTRQGVELRRGIGVDRIDRRDAGFSLGGEHYDDVVVATDVAAARRILERSAFVATESPALLDRMRAMRSGQRYAVWRIWIDRPSPTDVPVFLATERLRILDAVCFVDRIDPRARVPSSQGVLELHCYALPDDLLDAEAIASTFARELEHFFPELATASRLEQHLQVRGDFTALHVGMAGDRPTHDSGIDGLYLAGDWVRLPCPAMLMEAAHTAGRLAANAILARAGLRPNEVWTVPLRGMLGARRTAARK